LSSGYDKVDMLFIVPVKNNGHGATFRPRPEWLAG